MTTCTTSSSAPSPPPPLNDHEAQLRLILEKDAQEKAAIYHDLGLDDSEVLRSIANARLAEVKDLKASQEKLERENALLKMNTKMQMKGWKVTDVVNASWIPSLPELSGVVFPPNENDPYSSDEDDFQPPPRRCKRVDGTTEFKTYKRRRGYMLLPEDLPTDALALGEFIDPSLPPDDTNRFLTVRSPNVNYVLHPPIGWRDVHARKNARYGQDDFGQWPQHLHPATMHLAFVRKRPEDKSQEGWVWGNIWDDPVYVIATGQSDDNFRMRTQPIRHIWESVIAIRQACNRLRVARKGEGGTQHLKVLCSSLTVVVGSLRGAAFRKRDIMFYIAAAQRYYLETMALYEYLTKWVYLLATAESGSRKKNNSPPEVQKTLMGGFTTDPITLDKLYQLGIRVFYIQPSSQVPRSTTIRKVVDPLSFDGVSDEHDEPYPSVYQGLASAATCIAVQDIVLGGITYGLHTQGSLKPYNPRLSSQAKLSRIEEVGGPTIFGTFIVVYLR